MILSHQVEKSNSKSCARRIKNIMKCQICIITLDKDGLCYVDENDKFNFIEQKELNTHNVIGLEIY